MALFDNLEALIRAGFPNCETPAKSFAQMGTPSLSIAVLEDGDVSSRCYSTVGDDTETIFQACSISKPITALAVMRLVDTGALTLNSTIGSLLRQDILDVMTDGCSSGQRELTEGITVKQLLSHTAGLSTPDFPGYEPDTNSTRDSGWQKSRQHVENTPRCIAWPFIFLFWRGLHRASIGAGERDRQKFPSING